MQHGCSSHVCAATEWLNLAGGSCSFNGANHLVGHNWASARRNYNQKHLYSSTTSSSSSSWSALHKIAHYNMQCVTHVFTFIISVVAALLRSCQTQVCAYPQRGTIWIVWPDFRPRYLSIVEIDGMISERGGTKLQFVQYQISNKLALKSIRLEVDTRNICIVSHNTAIIRQTPVVHPPDNSHTQRWFSFTRSSPSISWETAAIKRNKHAIISSSPEVWLRQRLLHRFTPIIRLHFTNNRTSFTMII